jgi:hypothetical protein
MNSPAASAARHPGSPDVKLPNFGTGLIVAGGVWAVIGLGGILAFTGFSLPKLSLAVLATFASAAIGALVGFLFGVPKARSDTGGAKVLSDGSIEYERNTNLEQVSDWLTKIIVGVGLIQAAEIASAIRFVGEKVGGVIGDAGGTAGSGTVFAITLLVGSAVITFLLQYMWTSTRLYDVYTARTGRSIKS